MEDTKPRISAPAAILIGSVLISISILISGNVIKLKQPSSVLGQSTSQPSPSPSLGPQIANVSVDDDPVLGKSGAPVTIIEFSDYECPFCKRHFDQTYPQLKSDYIDKGKVKLVFRDFPLSIHDPMATIEAQAADCSRDQGGDSTYFSFHDEVFKRTTSNGNGLSKDKLNQIASDLKLNVDQFRSCLESGKYKEEVAKDIQDGGSANVAATPSFFIGKSKSSGVVQGTMVRGAQSYSVFKSLIDSML